MIYILIFNKLNNLKLIYNNIKNIIDKKLINIKFL